MLNNFSAVELDSLLRVLDVTGLELEYYDNNVKLKINELYELFDRIKSIDDDDLKILYFSVSRGDISKYVDYYSYDDLSIDCDESKYLELENRFKDDYPDDLYWYRLVTSKYKSYRTISINNRCIIYTDMDSDSSNFINNTLLEFLEFLIYKVKEIISMIEDNTYNDYIDRNLSYKNRFGVIKRSDYWKIDIDSRDELLKLISQDEIDYFIENASGEIDDRIENMTSGKYFECVSLVYDAIGYNIVDLNGRDLYLKYADGRDEGLSQIDIDSSVEFDNWYNDENRFGGHPYEIICGHSFSRVNLYIAYDDNGYYLSVNGNVILRKIEIVKIFNVLRKNGIPIRILNVDVIKKSISGNDYVGIVPDDIIPIKCESYFKDYEPKDFMHYDDKLFEQVIWQDIEKLYLK